MAHRVDAKVLSYGDVFLRVGDVNLLEPPHWLNDNLISFYFEYLQKECIGEANFMYLGPSVSFWLANSVNQAEFNQTLAQLKLDRKEVILLAINDNQELDLYGGGTHWSLLAFFKGDDTTEGKFVHYDSAGGSNNRYAQHLTDLLSKGLLGKHVEVIVQPSPQQVNGWDCGVYVLGVAKCLCEWYMGSKGRNVSELIESSVTPEKITKLRKEIKGLILQMARAAAV